MATTPAAKTYMAKCGELTAKWYLVDATDQILGRMSVKIATLLMGKHKPAYTPHVDTGDFVIVVNAEKVQVTGAKRAQKEYDSYSGYPGGRKVVTFEKMMALHPDRIVRQAVRRMLPKSRLGRKMLSKLKIYAGGEHPHQAQQPEEFNQ